MIFDLCQGDILKRDAVRHQPITLRVEWYYYLWRQREEKRQFLATLHQFRYELPHFIPPSAPKRPLSEALQQIIGSAKGSKIEVERVKVDKQELARRRQMKK